jgi:tRNA pseudouridine38-40 synthase
MRVKLVVAYDGTNYSGWQLQKNAVTIEQKLNEALSDLLGEEILVTGASRTDAGVHSLGNVCVFDTQTRIPAEKICYALNSRLPEDIVVQDSCEVAKDFHPRAGKSSKTYEYRVLNRKLPDPTRRRDTYFYHYDLDVEAMAKAAAYLEGEHDFKSFCSVHAQVETTVRTIYSCTVTKEDDMIRIRVTGNGFLYNMVRIIAGTALAVGYKNLLPSCADEALITGDRTKLGNTAAPCGLFLHKVEY